MENKNIPSPYIKQIKVVKNDEHEAKEVAKRASDSGKSFIIEKNSSEDGTVTIAGKAYEDEELEQGMNGELAMNVGAYLAEYMKAETLNLKNKLEKSGKNGMFDDKKDSLFLKRVYGFIEGLMEARLSDRGATTEGLNLKKFLATDSRADVEIMLSFAGQMVRFKEGFEHSLTEEDMEIIEHTGFTKEYMVEKSQKRCDAIIEVIARAVATQMKNKKDGRNFLQF